MFESLFAYILTGIIAGTLSGLLGIGGGIIIVPALAWIFVHFGFPAGHIMHVALGTSLAVIIFTTASGLQSHLKHKIEFMPIFKQLLIPIIIGVILGAVFSKLLPSAVLAKIFGVFALLMGIKMCLNPKADSDRHLPGLFGMSVAGTAIGIISGLLGLGAGATSVPFMTFYGVNMRKTVIISTAAGLVIAVVGTMSYILTGWHAVGLPKWHVGFIYLPALVSVALASVIFAKIGAYLSHRFSTKWLKILFGILLLVIGVHMLT
jgi:hypothetical protein